MTDKKVGFAAMEPERLREISSAAGKKSPRSGGFQGNPKRAKELSIIAVEAKRRKRLQREN